MLSRKEFILIIPATVLLTLFGLFMRARVEAKEDTNSSVSPAYPALVREVIDGDTIAVDVLVWPGFVARTSVRIYGIDTPETRQPGCDGERTRGKEATRFTSDLLPEGSTVILRNVRMDKFHGRVVAEIYTRQGQNVGSLLLAHGLARPYTGKGKRHNWCEELQQKKEGKEENASTR